MNNYIIKRDGRKVLFRSENILNVIRKVLNSVHPDDTLSKFEEQLAENITKDVILEVQKKLDPPTVEGVQDIVQDVLIRNSLVQEAKNFIEYRTKRTTAREFNDDITKVYRKMSESSSKDLDLMRENANINGDATMGLMLRFGSEACKDFITKYILKPEWTFAHKNGDFHMHDLDFSRLCWNCCQIDLTKLFHHGFSTGHGYLREPSSIRTASALACIALQSNQNDMFGGQSIAKFDYDLAPYVAKTFAINLCKVIEDIQRIELSTSTQKEIKDSIWKLYNKLNSVTKNTIFGENLDSLKAIIAKYVKAEDVDYTFNRTLKLTDNDTFQAMEALIHNLNTMQSRCLPGNENVVVKDNGFKNICDITTNDYVLSHNDETDVFEFKKVLRVLDNGVRDLIEIKLENGQRLRCTPDHKLYTSNGYQEAKDAKDILTPKGFVSIISKKEDKTEEVYDIEVEDNHNFCVKDKDSDNFVVVHNCGAQTPFSSINYGTCATEEGRLVIKNVLLATDKGLGRGETPIFPVQIFKVKKGVNYNKDEPNFDLFELACKVTAKRLFPNFLYIDAPQNLQYYKEGRPETELALMGCRTRVIGNDIHPEDAVVTGRGNFSFTTINLPRLGIVCKGDWDMFYEKLDNLMQLAREQLKERFENICKKHVYNYPFLLGQGVWIHSENLKPTDEVRKILDQSSISIGFIGLAECLKAMTGKHHGESEESNCIGHEILDHMNKNLSRYTKEDNLNWSLFATPAEGLSGRFVKIDAKRYGKIPGVTDRDYYTNSFHVPVYYNISAEDKIKIEGPYHEQCNAGSISYVEIDGDPSNNIPALEKLVKYAGECNMNYFSINHPVDRCPVCGYTGIINDKCPVCGRKEFEAVSVEKLRSCGCDLSYLE